MNYKSVLILFISIMFVVGCSAPKVLVSEKSKAEKAMAAGNFSLANQAWKLYFAQTPIENVAGEDFARAAQTAFKSGDSNQAVSWYDQARYKNFGDAEMYLTLAEIYKSQKNISKEMSALEYVNEHFVEKSAATKSRLFDIYSEIKLKEKALQVWNDLSLELKNDGQKLETYFLIQKELKDSTVCDSLANVILEKDANNREALEWNAIKYYWMGENRYQCEMDVYNKNKTNRQYKILIKELDLATADMKKSLVFFEKLWDIQPGEKYASYFANIYARFGDEKKAKYYQRIIK